MVPDFAERLATPVGDLLFVRDSAVAQSIKKHVRHDPGVDYFMRKHRANLFPFFDCGANVGLFSVMAAKLGGPVFAFEPDEKNLDLLGRNVTAQGVDVRIFPVACGARDGTCSLGTLSCGRSIKSRTDRIDLPARSLRSVIAETGVAPRFLKIDVEGAETEILLGLEGARDSATAVIEAEFSWRDHGPEFDHWLRLRPPDGYDWEFLLTEGEVSAEPDFGATPLDFDGRRYFSVTARSRDQLDRIIAVLAARTQMRGSLKWELGISPRFS